MAAPRVRLVVLNFEGGEDVLRCLSCVEQVDWPAERLEVVVVDNASTDGSADAVADRFPGVRLIRRSTNAGFPANNDALRDLTGIDYVGLVNNDAFVEPGYLRPLVEALAADATLGAACPKILLADRYRLADLDVAPGQRLEGPDAIPLDGWVVDDDLVDPRPRATGGRATALLPAGEDGDGSPVLDVIANVGNRLTPAWFGADRGLRQPDRGQFDEPVDVFAWCGAAVLFPSGYLTDVGLFDERLFLYYEDLDLAWRGRARGWRYRTVPTSVVRHRLAASSVVGSTLFRYHVERNRLVVLVKNAPAAVAAAAPLRHLLASLSYLRRDVLARLVRGRRPAPALLLTRLRALLGFLRLLPHALRERRRITRLATVVGPARLRGTPADLQHSSPT